jgi:hypothetical protein
MEHMSNIAVMGAMQMKDTQFSITESYPDKADSQNFNAISEHNLSVTPRIGIFWLHYSGAVKIFYAHPVTIDLGQAYGDFINTLDSHYDVWESLKSQGFITSKIDYTYLPRGRILYNKITSKYVVYTGSWISSASSAIKSVLASEFKLKKRSTVYETDLHYNHFSKWNVKLLSASCFPHRLSLF